MLDSNVCACTRESDITLLLNFSLKMLLQPATTKSPLELLWSMDYNEQVAVGTRWSMMIFAVDEQWENISHGAPRTDTNH